MILPLYLGCGSTEHFSFELPYEISQRDSPPLSGGAHSGAPRAWNLCLLPEELWWQVPVPLNICGWGRLPCAC